MRRHILITARLYGAGGIETHLLNLCRLLVDNGAEVTFVTRLARPETPLVQLAREIPIRLISTPFANDLRWFRLSTVWALLVWPLLLRRRRFDVLYTVEISRFTEFLARFVKSSGRVIAGRIGEPLKDHSSIYPKAKDVLDGVIVETPVQAVAFQAAVPADVPVAAIPLLGQYSEPPKRTSRSVDELRIAFLGRYDRAKGIYRLLQLWKALDIQPARLDFHGHGKETDNLRQEIEDRGLRGVHVNGGWTGVNELSAILARTDLVVLPSETEGLPVVLLEAMAYGVPFVATDVGAVCTFADDNPDVRVVALDDAALKDGIEEMGKKIRSGQIRGDRLQGYHRSRYSYEYLSRRWVDALLNAEQFWRTLSAMDPEIDKLSSEASVRSRT
jgi:glycosyltransferase involved in cell wall biosynthesis